MSTQASDNATPTPNTPVMSADLERLDIVAVGHVDHGKSTVIGRLMADTGSLPEGKLDQVKAMCKINARPFEYAFLLDALKNEQAQGITIDTARCFFTTPKRHYIIHDAPGHVEFLKNMITGASRAQAALLVIDAQEGVRENSKRHGYILSMLGIRQIAVLVNKMDLLDWDQEAFDAVTREYADFLARLGVRPTCFIPVSARDGANIVARAAEAPWYDGPTVLEQIEDFKRLDDDLERPFRMPLQDVYKFTAADDDRRIFVGTVETGRIRPGDDVVFLPSGKRSTVATIEALSGPRPDEAYAGQATGLTLDTQVYAKPGELMVRADQPAPLVADRLRANVFWMATAPLVRGRRYVLRMGAARVPVELESVLSVLDSQELQSVTGAAQVERHDVAEVVFRSTRPVAFDAAETLEPTSRFVVVAGFDTAGCGIALEALPEAAGRRRRRAALRRRRRERRAARRPLRPRRQGGRVRRRVGRGRARGRRFAGAPHLRPRRTLVLPQRDRSRARQGRARPRGAARAPRRDRLGDDRRRHRARGGARRHGPLRPRPAAGAGRTPRGLRHRARRRRRPGRRP